MLTHYELLGVEKTSSHDEIRKAYRSMSKKHHPDLNGGKGSALFSAVNEAYEILGHEEKRAAYDAQLGGPSMDPPHAEPNSSDSGQDQYREYAPRADESNVTRDTPGGVRQVKVNWSDYGWFNTERSEPVTVVNPRPHRLARTGIVLGYWLSMVLLGVFSLAAGSYVEHDGGAMPFGVILAIVGLVMGFTLQIRSNEEPPLLWNALHLGWVVATVVWASYFWSSWSLAVIPLAAVVGFLGVISGIWGKKVESEKVWMSPRPKLSKKDLLSFFQWGEAGNLGDAVGKFGEQNVSKGIAGEKYTEKLFQELYRIPAVRLFHGLKFPGSEVADVDHAILVGDTVIFIDSKQWSPGTYGFSNTLGSIVQSSGDDMTMRTTNFNRAVNGYRWLMPKRFTVYGVMLIHGVGVVIDESADSQDGVRMLDTRGAMDVIGTVCAKESNHIDLRVANVLANSLKA